VHDEVSSHINVLFLPTWGPVYTAAGSSMAAPRRLSNYINPPLSPVSHFPLNLHFPQFLAPAFLYPDRRSHPYPFHNRLAADMRRNGDHFTASPSSPTPGQSINPSLRSLPRPFLMKSGCYCVICDSHPSMFLFQIALLFPGSIYIRRVDTYLLRCI
jgi:hypothetical protein